MGDTALRANRVTMRVNDLPLEGVTSAYVSAEVNTDAVALKGAKRLGVFMDVAAVDSASYTVDVDLEISYDGGTTWVDMPDSEDDETVADLAQFTAAAKSATKWFQICSDSYYSYVRAEITVDAGTATDEITWGPCYFILSDYN